MTDVVDTQPDRRGGQVAARVAGVLLLLLGAANLVLAGIATWTALIRVSDGTAATLALLGLLTAVLGVFVLRGRRWALVTSALVFGGLFVLQAFAASGGEDAPALLTLAIVVVPLVLALRGDRAAR